MKYQIQKSVVRVAFVVIGLLFATSAPRLSAQVIINSTSFTVNGAGTVNAISNTLVTTTAPFLIGTTGSAAAPASGTGGNTVTISNFLFTASGNGQLGFNSQNNIVILLTNTTLNLNTHIIQIGNGNSSTPSLVSSNNILEVLGGAVIDNGIVALGTNVSGQTWGNSFIVSNGGFAQLTGLRVGYQQSNSGGLGHSNNFAYVSNITVAAGMLLNTGSIDVGYNQGAGNTGVLDNVKWNGSGIGEISVGGGRQENAGGTFAQYNGLVVQDNSQLTNFTLINVGFDINGQKGSALNTLTIQGTGSVVAAANTGVLNIGVAEGSTFGNAFVGGQSNNAVQVLSGATLLSGTTTVGEMGGGGTFTAFANNNSVLVNGSVWTNSLTTSVGIAAGGLLNGSGAANFNSIASNNNITVTGGGTFWTGGLIVGEAVNAFAVAETNTAGGNRIFVTGGSSLIDTGSLIVGEQGAPAGGTGPQSATGNSVTLSNGSLLQVNSMTTGLGGGTGNTISNYSSTYQFTTATPTIVNNGFGNIAINNGTISFLGVANADVTNSVGNGALSPISYSGNNTFALNGSSTAASGQNYTFGTGQPNGASNYANLVMVNGNTAYNGGDITVASTGTMLISNTFATISGLVTNQGSLTVASAHATYQGAVYNSGTVTVQNSIGTFNSAVVNNGTWASDPSSLVFSSTFSNGPSGIITASPGDVYTFKSNFLNQSTQNTAYDTHNALFVFAGGAGTYAGNADAAPTQTMQVAGLNLGGYRTTFPGQTSNDIFFVGGGVNVSTNSFQFSTVPKDSIFGYSNNFSVAALSLQNTTLELSDSFASSTHTAGLYVTSLTLDSSSDLIVSNNVQVYFMSTNGVTGLAFGTWAENPSANVLLLDGSGFHAIVVVPEPSILLMWVVGLASVYFVRRRRPTVAKAS